MLLSVCLFFSDGYRSSCRLVVMLLLVGEEASPCVGSRRSAIDRMASESVFLPCVAGSCPRCPWTSSISLHRFVWALHLDAGLGSSPRLECRRAALAVWLHKLDISVNGSESGAPASSPDEEMLDWLVVSVRSGWTPRAVMTCFFPVFRGLVVQMISDHAEEI